MARRTKAGAPPDPCEPIPYIAFTGEGTDWDSVRDALASEQNEARRAGLYMFVSRSTVLGRMKQLKEMQYADYLAQLRAYCSDRPEPIPGGVPWEPGDLF